MEKTRIIFMYAIVVILVATACNYQSADDNRLLTAAQLIDSKPDSAYSILKDIDNASLSGKSNRAYHSLLMTQALYKTYRPILSDSLINIALYYYPSQFNFPDECRVLFARSLMQKGNVMRELNQADSALYFYSRAKSYLDSLRCDEYLLFAEVNYRIAWLFNDAYMPNKVFISYFKTAAEYYKKANNREYQLYCLEQIGSLHRRDNTDSSFKYSKAALLLANELNMPDIIHSVKTDLIGTYYIDEQFDKAKELAKSVVKDSSDHFDKGEAMAYLSMAYAKLRMPDSARFFLNKTKLDLTQERYKALFLKANDVVLYSEGRFDEAYDFFRQTEMKNDSVMNASDGRKLIDAEQKFQEILTNEKIERESIRNFYIYISILIGILIVAAIGLFLLIRYRKQLQAKHQYISELSKNISISKQELTNLKEQNRELISQLSEKQSLQDSDNSSLEATTDSLIALNAYISEVGKAVSIIEANPNTKNSVNIFNKSLTDFELNDSFWRNLRNFVNLKYDNLADRLIKEYPIILQDKNLNIILMICCGFSTQTICYCLKFSSRNVYNVTINRLAKKMELTESLNKFVKYEIEKSLKIHNC